MTGFIVEGAYVLVEGKVMRVAETSQFMFNAEDCDGTLRTYGKTRASRYTGIVPPPCFMDEEQYNGLMANYD